MTSPFWTDQAQFHASNLWLPPTDSLEYVDYGSWFSVLEQPALQSSCLVIDGPASPSSTNYLKALKIRLYPNASQRQILRGWFGAARWTYNRALDLTHEDSNLRFDKTLLRQQCINKELFQNTELAWLLDTPASIRQEAVFDLLKAYKSAISKYQSQGQSFELSYRSKKDFSQSLVIQNQRLNVQGKSCWFFTTYLPGKLKTKQVIPPVQHDCRLQWFPKLNHFYLCIPIDVEVRSENQAPAITNSSIYQRIVSLDPGVRTFITGYDSRGLAFKWGYQDISRIYRLCHHYGKLQSQWSQSNIRHRKRYRLKRAGARLQLKIRNLVDDLHKNLVKYLCQNFDLIIIPIFETQGMIRRGHRRINSATARKMLTWAHYRFRQRLISKAREYRNCHVLVVTEEYTSKTCGRCGRLNQNLGGKKMFRCSNCGLEIDRDINGARNILIKMLSK